MKVRIMSFSDLNEKIRDDYTKCLDTVLDGAQRVIDFMNSTTISCSKKEQVAPQKQPQIIDKVIDTAIGAVTDNIPILKGIKTMKNFLAEAPIPPIKIDREQQSNKLAKLVNWGMAQKTIHDTLVVVTDIREIVANEVKDEDLKYKLELKLWEIQKELNDTLQLM